MTDESHGDGPDEAPIPPASTRWSEDALQDDDALAPPFVPGRQESAPAREAGPESVPSPEIEEAATEEESFPFDLPAGAEVADESREETAAGEAAEDDFPFEQFDIEGESEEGAGAVTEAAQEPLPDAAPDVIPDVQRAAGPAGTDVAEPGAAAGDTAGDVAALLDRLARTLRTEGEVGIRREMESPDRLTALLAGLVAGYLSGRR